MPREIEAGLNDVSTESEALLGASWTGAKSITSAQDVPDGSSDEVGQDKLEYFVASDILQKTISDLEATTPSNCISVEKSTSQAKIGVVPERFLFVMYNILRGSINYLDTHPDLKIKIGVEERFFEGQSYTSIYIHDDGPGVAPNALPGMFDGSEGRGESRLGLVFCKRSMKDFGGDVICESEQGKWTKFSLLFPVVEGDVAAEAVEPAKKKILIVDDEQINLLTAKSRIKKNLPDVECVIVNTPEEAISLALKEDHGFGLILSDFEMPNINGYQLSSKIRRSGSDIPIIIYSSRRHRDFFGEMDFRNAPFSQYLRKDVKNPILYRTIVKWLKIKDSMEYLGDEKEYLKVLEGKTILMAGGDGSSYGEIKKEIESCGAKVIEVTGGGEMVDSYVKSLDEGGSIDAIVSDIDMAELRGDEASKEIRTIELKRKIFHSQRVPIIALLESRDDENIKKYLDCKMTDYHIKEDKPELVAKMIANYLNRL